MGVIGNMPEGAKALLEQSSSLSDAGRILIPRRMVEDMLPTLHTGNGCCMLSMANAASTSHRTMFILARRVARSVFVISKIRPNRDTTLLGVYDAARLIYTLSHIH